MLFLGNIAPSGQIWQSVEAPISAQGLVLQFQSLEFESLRSYLLLRRTWNYQGRKLHEFHQRCYPAPDEYVIPLKVIDDFYLNSEGSAFEVLKVPRYRNWANYVEPDWSIVLWAIV